MTNVQIMGGGNLENAIKEIAVNAKKLVQTVDKYSEIFSLQVWEMSVEEFDRFSKIANEMEWDSELHGWWRNSGCNADHEEVIEFNVNEQVMKGFKNDCNYYHSEEYIKDCTEEGVEATVRPFDDINEYLESYWGATKSENITYFIHSLAPINNMTKEEFVRVYFKEVV